MTELFDPDKPGPNYAAQLKAHYRKSRARTGNVTIKKRSYLVDNYDPLAVLMGHVETSRHFESAPLKPHAEEEQRIQSTVPLNVEFKSEIQRELTDEEAYAITSGQAGFYKENGTKRTVRELFYLICRAYGVIDLEETLRSRKTNFVRLRANIVQTLYVFLGDKTSLIKMGSLLGKDHTTMIHLINIYSINKEETLKNYSNIKYKPL